jgi:hypothetical protein
MHAKKKNGEQRMEKGQILMIRPGVSSTPAWYLPENRKICPIIKEEKRRKRKLKRELKKAFTCGKPGISSSAPAVGVRVIPCGNSFSGPHRGRHRAENAGAAERGDGHGWQATRGWNHVPQGAHRARPGVHAVVALGSEIQSANVEPLGAAIFHVPVSLLVSQSCFW